MRQGVQVTINQCAGDTIPRVARGRRSHESYPDTGIRDENGTTISIVNAHDRHAVKHEA